MKNIIPKKDPDKSSAALTINSLKMINDFPFYSASYYGDYKLREFIGGAIKNPDDVVPFFEKLFSDQGLPTQLKSSAPPQNPGGCSAFFGKTKEDRAIVGKNIDWKRDPLLLLKTRPSGGYTSLSISNLTFCDLFQLKSLEHQLLLAPYVPLDGINEKGLVISMLAVHEGCEYSYSPERISVGDFNIIRIILDTCKNVDEAVSVFNQYNIVQTGMLPLHYLIADNEISCILEFSNGRIISKMSKKKNYLTNFNKLKKSNNSQKSLNGNNQDSNESLLCPRYQILKERIENKHGSLTLSEAKKLLRDTSVFQPDYAVPSTICSLLYQPDQLNLKIHIGKEPKIYSVSLHSEEVSK